MMIDQSPPSKSADVPLYRVGTLVYEKPQLYQVFFWMLWGDFCLNLMDSGVWPYVIPLQLKKYGASMESIGFLTGSLVEIMSIIMVVIISTWSDRHRGPLGRRMPFMLYATPPLAACLIAVGFSPHIAQWLQHAFPHLFGGFAITSLVVGVIATTMIAYKFFDLFPQTVYYYLFADVIPPKLMGTFVSLFRVCGTFGVLFFNWKLLKHAEDSPGLICSLAGGLYFFAFVMLALMVREGEYPTPEPIQKGPLIERFYDTSRKYIRECYSMAYYWKFYIFGFCYMVGTQAFFRFLVFYGKQMTGGDLDKLGKINVVASIVQIVIFFSVGPLIDWLHPIRASLAGYVLLLITSLAGLFLIHGPGTYAAFAVLTMATIALVQAAYLSLLPRILPREQYGQFNSANSMLWHFGLMILLPVCGSFIDHYGNPVVFAWLAGSAVGALIMLSLVIHDWKRFGGDEHYVPPIPWLPPEAKLGDEQ
jgi:maltose/moltooligosaccharide transporter